MAEQNKRGGSLRKLASLILVLNAAWLAGCSTITKVDPMPNERQGLLDHLLSMQPAGLGLRPDQPADDVSSDDLRQARLGARDWRWPLKKVQVTSEYGRRDGRYHEGVDLRAKVGTPVYAVDDGTVSHSGKLSGYGRMVVVRHAGGLFSVYAHHSRNLVKKGEKVKRGQKIALSGNSGRSSGPHLHFEVRKGVAAVDPLRILPRKGSGTVALFSP